MSSDEINTSAGLSDKKTTRGRCLIKKNQSESWKNNFRIRIGGQKVNFPDRIPYSNSITR
jgi:hypothetical protein